MGARCSECPGPVTVPSKQARGQRTGARMPHAYWALRLFSQRPITEAFFLPLHSHLVSSSSSSSPLFISDHCLTWREERQLSFREKGGQPGRAGTLGKNRSGRRNGKRWNKGKEPPPSQKHEVTACIGCWESWLAGWCGSSGDVQMSRLGHHPNFFREQERGCCILRVGGGK